MTFGQGSHTSPMPMTDCYRGSLRQPSLSAHRGGSTDTSHPTLVDQMADGAGKQSVKTDAEYRLMRTAPGRGMSDLDQCLPEHLAGGVSTFSFSLLATHVSANHRTSPACRDGSIGDEASC